MAAILGAAYLAATQGAAYYHYRLALEAADKDDYAKALPHITRAASLASRYESWVHYLRAHHHMQQRQDALAVKEFEQVAGVFGHEPAFQINYRIARLNHAWESDDYVAYLQHAEELIRLRPDHTESVMCIAAGNAYRYAQTGQEDFRRRSEEYLAQLGKMDTANAYEERIGRIRRCLETRVIPPH